MDGEAVTACACCGVGLEIDECVPAMALDEWRCNRCFLGRCGCALDPKQQAAADAQIDRLAAEGARMERDARPWRDDEEYGEGARDGR